ncbi:hypothetical protein [Candidatus Magnetomonas plexicatena]|uniref:hypothetical protein n=1 Tax=Candidatus Magnetomonas plexicatena TaxID=2552947 RepID=UPI001C7637D9|nr:hypothetical protein E2O03_000680 [Nitrospirales bacterium LBB_01]
MSTTAVILSFITGAISFIWLNVVFVRNGMGRGLAMFLSSTAGSVVSTAVYYIVNALF